MSSLNYDEIFSRFYTKAEAYDFLDLTEIQITEFMCNYLHSSVSDPYVRRLFSSITLDDEIQIVTYTMKYVIDDETDKEFVTEALALNLLIKWLMPKVNSLRNIRQTYGTTELKFYSESSHMKQMQELLHTAKKELKRTIADRGYMWNTYLDGES